MKAPTVVLFVLVVAAQPSEPARFVGPNSVDLKVTRRTADHPNSPSVTETLYVKGARRREERLILLPPTVSEPRTHQSTTITLCDERRRVELNDDARTYIVMPLDDLAEHLKLARARASRMPPPDTSGPEVRIIVDSVDTGERRQLGRYVARHIVTTTTTEAAPGAHHQSSTHERDGWYIDLPGCWQNGNAEAFALLGGEVTRPGEPLDRIHLERRGTAPLGYAVGETSRSGGAHEYTERIELIDFSEAALDPRLFAVPPDYRPALPTPNGGFDLTKPDTILNRVELYCGLMASWVQGFFRNSKSYYVVFVFSCFRDFVAVLPPSGFHDHTALTSAVHLDDNWFVEMEMTDKRRLAP